MNFTIEAQRNYPENNWSGVVKFGGRHIVLTTVKNYPEEYQAMEAAEDLFVAKLGELFAKQTGNE